MQSYIIKKIYSMKLKYGYNIKTKSYVQHINVLGLSRYNFVLAVKSLMELIKKTSF